ncbi:hypothetical protein ACFQJC_15415 [Haloferax namakaokahaiae]|uniref:Ig-like domain-containing protein n=1 Tax=Haloferax namakaokahaiae TaxID=1748331 RepID=A0ABD5ZI87_9EURY
MSGQWTRRSFLVAAGALGLAASAGCLDGVGSARGVTDIVFHNETPTAQTVALSVTHRRDDSTVVETTIELPAHSQHTVNNEVVMKSDYDVRVSATAESDDEPYTETYTWKDANQPLHVIVNDQLVFAVQVG